MLAKVSLKLRYSKTPLNAVALNAGLVLRGSIGIAFNHTLYWYLLYRVRHLTFFFN